MLDSVSSLLEERERMLKDDYDRDLALIPKKLVNEKKELKEALVGKLNEEKERRVRDFVAGGMPRQDAEEVGKRWCS